VRAIGAHQVYRPAGAEADECRALREDDAVDHLTLPVHGRVRAGLLRVQGSNRNQGLPSGSPRLAQSEMNG